MNKVLPLSVIAVESSYPSQLTVVTSKELWTNFHYPNLDN